MPLCGKEVVITLRMLLELPADRCVRGTCFSNFTLRTHAKP